MSQQSLDTPFTGGLGSYKLYVLVAYHVHRHLALGGSDRPGEVLLSFLYRYGCGAGNDRNDHATTRLRQYVPLQAHDGASADLSNVYKLDECIHLFRLCWDRLWERVQKSKQSKRDARKKKNSLLAVVVCPDRLRRDREATLGLLDQSLGRLEHVMNTQEPPAAPPQRGSTTQPKEAKAPPIDPRQCPPTIMRDRTLEEIVAGYGVSVEDLTSN